MTLQRLFHTDGLKGRISHWSLKESNQLGELLQNDIDDHYSFRYEKVPSHVCVNDFFKNSCNAPPKHIQAMVGVTDRVTGHVTGPVSTSLKSVLTILSKRKFE